MTSTTTRPNSTGPNPAGSNADIVPVSTPPMASFPATPHASPLGRDPWFARTSTWHRPLLWVAVLHGIAAVVFLALAILAPVEITGANAWFKPLKFTISIGVYAATLAWIMGRFPRFRRAVWWAGTAIAVLLAVEMLIIGGAPFFGSTSHYNSTSPANQVAYTIMGVSIVAVWAITAAFAAAEFLVRDGDRARSWAIRLGLIVTVIGMPLAFFMTAPTAAQTADYQGIAGAHTVGAADGGPGLWFLGWSTEAGDLRIAHFLGLHALQALPILVIALEWGARRVAVLRDVRVRTRLVWIAAFAWLAVTALTLVQALAGEPIVAPSLPTVFAGAGIAVATAVASVFALRTQGSPGSPRSAVTPRV